MSELVKEYIEAVSKGDAEKATELYHELKKYE